VFEVVPVVPVATQVVHKVKLVPVVRAYKKILLGLIHIILLVVAVVPTSLGMELELKVLVPAAQVGVVLEEHHLRQVVQGQPMGLVVVVGHQMLVLIKTVVLVYQVLL
jgi:hypothetical protein